MTPDGFVRLLAEHYHYRDAAHVDGLIAMTPDVQSTQAIRDFARNFSMVLLDPGAAIPECSTLQ